MTFARISNINGLETSHEEADTKIIFHALHLKEGRNVNVTIFSPSGDTDITVSLLAGHVDGHGEDKKIKWDWL